MSEKKKTEEEEEAERLEKLIEEKLNGINLDNDYVLSSSEDDKADANPQPERNHVTEGASVGFGAETFVRNNLDSLLGMPFAHNCNSIFYFISVNLNR